MSTPVGRWHYMPVSSSRGPTLSRSPYSCCAAGPGCHDLDKSMPGKLVVGEGYGEPGVVKTVNGYLLALTCRQHDMEGRGPWVCGLAQARL